MNPLAVSAIPEDFSAELTALQSPLKYFLLSLTGSIDDAEEVLQETNAVALAKRDEFQSGTNLKAWVFTIARRQALAFHRQQTRRRSVFQFDEGLIELIGDDSEQINENSFAQDRDFLKVCLEKLSQPHRQLILQRYLRGRRVADIASEESLEPNALAQKLFRIRRKLAQCIEQQRKDHPDSEA